MIKDIEKVIRLRKSIRTFTNIDIEPEKKQLILDFMKDNSVGIFGNKVDFYWIDGSSDKFKDVKLGTYGVISGTKCFIVGKVRDSDKNFEDFGYCMEKLVLYCAQLNIGTCWMGGTYKKTAFSTAVDLKDDELIPAVTPIGYFGTRKRTIDKMFRHFAGSDNRKPFEELFFSGTFLQQLSQKEKETYGYFLEMVRLAPSASNKQPWRVVVIEKVLHFFLKRTPNYNKTILHSDLQRVDMGIAISHLELALNEKNISHKWIVRNPDLDLDEMTEYIASCEIH
ncbi:MAG: nitroreductase family protein [Paludibacter sp.]|nr:nitroreductase family protein [Paludibacter sp.]